MFNDLSTQSFNSLINRVLAKHNCKQSVIEKATGKLIGECIDMRDGLSDLYLRSC